jgi:hypothetical protein
MLDSFRPMPKLKKKQGYALARERVFQWPMFAGSNETHRSFLTHRTCCRQAGRQGPAPKYTINTPQTRQKQSHVLCILFHSTGSDQKSTHNSYVLWPITGETLSPRGTVTGKGLGLDPPNVMTPPPPREQHACHRALLAFFSPRSYHITRSGRAPPKNNKFQPSCMPMAHGAHLVAIHNCSSSSAIACSGSSSSSSPPWSRRQKNPNKTQQVVERNFTSAAVTKH